MALGRGEYSSALSQGDILDSTYVADLLEAMESRFIVGNVPCKLMHPSRTGAKITERLSRLPLRVARVRGGWSRLVIGFLGSGRQLTTETMGTPYPRGPAAVRLALQVPR